MTLEEQVSELRNRLIMYDKVVIPFLDDDDVILIKRRLSENEAIQRIEDLRRHKMDAAATKARAKKLRDLRNRVADLEKELQDYKTGARSFRGTLTEMRETIRKQDRYIMELEIKAGIVKLE